MLVWVVDKAAIWLVCQPFSWVVVMPCICAWVMAAMAEVVIASVCRVDKEIRADVVKAAICPAVSPANCSDPKARHWVVLSRPIWVVDREATPVEFSPMINPTDRLVTSVLLNAATCAVLKAASWVVEMALNCDVPRELIKVVGKAAIWVVVKALISRVVSPKLCVLFNPARVVVLRMPTWVELKALICAEPNSENWVLVRVLTWVVLNAPN